MKCTLENCAGEYEERRVVHTVRHDGRLFVIDHVPAEVCSVCGDVLLRPDTLRHIENLLHSAGAPVGSVPLYEYAWQLCAQSQTTRSPSGAASRKFVQPVGVRKSL